MKNIIRSLLFIICTQNTYANCIFKIRLIGKQAHKASEITVLNFQEKPAEFINDSVAIYSFNPSEPTNAMILLSRNERWHTYVWIIPNLDTVELCVDFTHKLTEITHPSNWDLVFNAYLQLFNTGNIDKADQYAAAYIEKNTNSYLSLWLLNHGVAFHNRALKTKLFGQLDPQLANYSDYADVKKDLEQRREPMMGQTFKEFSLRDIQGKIFESAKISNKVIILHFWTNSCKACHKSIDELTQFEACIDTSQVCIISVCFDKEEKDWQKAINSHKIKWTNLWQSNGVYCDLCLHYDLTVMPLYLVFNRDKKLDAVIEGDALNLLKRELMKF